MTTQSQNNKTVSPPSPITTPIKHDSSDDGLFAGLQLSSRVSNTDKTPRLSNSSSGKMVAITAVDKLPPPPALQVLNVDSSSEQHESIDSNFHDNRNQNNELGVGDILSEQIYDTSSTKSTVAQVSDETVEHPNVPGNVSVAFLTSTDNVSESISVMEKCISSDDEKALNDAFTTREAHNYENDQPKQGSKTVGSKTDKAMSKSKLSPSKQNSSTRRGVGQVDPATPIPHADVCLAFLRKFSYKTQAHIPTEYGGTKAKSLWQYVMPADPIVVKETEAFFGPYREIMDLIFDENHPRIPPRDDSQNHDDESEGTNKTITLDISDNDISDDVKSRAAKSLALFVHLFSVWGHASSSFLERKDSKSLVIFSLLQASIFDAASNLVAYGCLDSVRIVLDNEHEEKREYHQAAQILAQSIFNSDLSIERNELAAIKFLLGAGCRVVTFGNDDALLRGSYLLQAIRTLYHVYLTTDSEANKITARAALQQLVTNVFAKAVRTPVSESVDIENFPSENHRDAFLVLRSICKLSMRNIPDISRLGDDGVIMHNHVGIQSSASNETWDGERVRNGNDLSGTENREPGRSLGREPAQLIYTSAVHPALESKLLALELILYILQHVDFSSNGFIHNCGMQFHSSIRNYLCVSLLKNCTADSTKVVSLSLRVFVPTVRHFRTILKTEIEAFVTNVFFVILDSKNSPAEHKRLVVNTFYEICSDPNTLAEIFLNYDCDLSAVDLFHRIVNSLSKLARSGYDIHGDTGKGSLSSGLSSLLLNASGPSEAQLEKIRNDGRELRLDSMRALRQILASLHASIVEPLQQEARHRSRHQTGNIVHSDSMDSNGAPDPPASPGENGSRQNLVEIYGSKKKRRAEESEAILRFNQKPSAGIAYAAKCGHLDDQDPADVARYLLKHKDELDKTQIGEYLGREPDYQKGFSIAVLHEYVRLLDFLNLVFDDAIRYFLSGFRLPGEAQKIDRIMEKFAERFTEQNPDVFPSADAAFILSFSIIMLNTDLHNPAIKEERRMTKEGFIRNNRGICDGKDLPEELLTSIFDRIKANPISLKEDDEAREKRSGDAKRLGTGLPAALSPASFFTSHYAELNRARESNFQKERDHIVRTTESFLKRRRHSQATIYGAGNPLPGKSRSSKYRSSRFVLSSDSGLRDEYVSPMFDVTWGPALAAFSTAIESANGTTAEALVSIASEDELEHAAENAAETIEVCLTGFRFAICTAGLCGNSIARDAYMLALSRFSQLGAGVLLHPRHVRCVQTMLSLAREDGELLGGSWEHVFRALSEVNRYHQLFQLMARNDRAAARTAEVRRVKLEAKEKRRRERQERKVAAEDGESIDDGISENSWGQSETDDDSLADFGLDDEDFLAFDDELMDAKAIDEANSREIYAAVSEATIEAIYERSSSLSAVAVKEFVLQLCQVSRREISVGNNKQTDLNQVTYRQKHSLLDSKLASGEQFHHTQPNIYNLQKLVEVTHYNMDSRPRLLFADIWVTVADHLTNVALHSNAAVAMYAVDSFRQLSIQYLKREELEVFEFQKRFLKPLETVMARSDQSSTKELLLNCVDRIIHVFRGDESGSDSKIEKGGLRSGWVPILNILGIGGSDSDAKIAQMSFTILSSELNLCVHDENHQEVLLMEHFIETAQALMKFLKGPHHDLSLLAIEHVVELASYLANEVQVKSSGKRRINDTSHNECDFAVKESLELWWPVLLGISQAVGDDRILVRTKALESLVLIINKHFFSADPKSTVDNDVQTLQLIFRGVLTPILEFAETSSTPESSPPSLPEDFELFLNFSDDGRFRRPANDEHSSSNWLETTFDSFMDACVAICLRTIQVYERSTLVEEVFAVLNSCLLSDSGFLAVRGLRRLEQFVASDLDSALLTDDVWATVSHMLRRCLSVKGLPAKLITSSQSGDAESHSDDKRLNEIEHSEDVQEFIMEERMLSNRRYVGSNAAMVVGLLLTSDRFAIGLRWRLFLTAGLGRGIIEWERVASILTPPNSTIEFSTKRPPDYRETTLYGRKWMNRLLLQLASMPDIVEAPADADPKTNRFATGQKLVADLTQSMLISFVEKERLASKFRNSAAERAIYVRLTGLVVELLTGYGNMDSLHLQKMTWINPVLLSSCIQSKNEEIRLMVQKLVGRTTSYKDPPGKKYNDSSKQKSQAGGSQRETGNASTDAVKSENHEPTGTHGTAFSVEKMEL